MTLYNSYDEAMASSEKRGLESPGQSLDPGQIRHERHQSLIFGSGSRMSRELFRELSSVEGPSDVNAFLALMHAAMGLEVRRAGIAATMSPGTRSDPVELLSLWLDAQ